MWGRVLGSIIIDYLIIININVFTYTSDPLTTLNELIYYASELIGVIK
jgi:hypothetical protein